MKKNKKVLKPIKGKKNIRITQHALNRFNERFGLNMTIKQLQERFNGQRHLINEAPLQTTFKLFFTLELPCVAVVRKTLKNINIITMYIDEDTSQGKEYIKNKKMQKNLI